MFCFQCQETLKNIGCNLKMGVCGKTDEVAKLQDLLVYTTKGLSILANIAKNYSIFTDNIGRYITEALFVTITNVNFSKTAILKKIKQGIELRENLKREIISAGGKDKLNNLHDSVNWNFKTDLDIIDKSMTIGILNEKNEDIRSLKELITYGIKGMSAYFHHAKVLGFEDKNIYDFIYEGLEATTKDLDINTLIDYVMKTGKFAVDTMALLDKANTSTYGHPEITKVKLSVRNRPGILISGHDLKDLEMLLEQSKDSGVDIYTHGEMLPAHYYPAFKKYSHFIGNYGNAWWRQKEEFRKFNGPILMTTNCLVPPDKSYIDRVYTTGVVGFEGVKHIPEKEDGTKDFSQIIEHAKKCSPPEQLEEGEIIGGFAHHQVLALADKVVEAVKSGAIKKFVVMAGCDGRHKERQYYTEFAKALPKDTVILTAGCAKYRYNKLNLGDIGGIPRVLDAGQCNDSYSLAVIALKLKEVFNLNDINDLPIIYNIAWYEQKAVTVLLALLYLGVKDIHIGPTLPAFVSKNVLNVLVEKFNLSGITTVEQDMKKFFPDLSLA